MKYEVKIFNPGQSAIYEAKNYHEIIDRFKENNPDLRVDVVYKQNDVVQCNVYSQHGLFIDILEIVQQ